MEKTGVPDNFVIVIFHLDFYDFLQIYCFIIVLFFSNTEFKLKHINIPRFLVTIVILSILVRELENPGIGIDSS